jgi:hypothetical protein
MQRPFLPYCFTRRPWRNLKRVQGHQVRWAARQHMRNIQYVYIGNAAQLPERELRRN